MTVPLPVQPNPRRRGGLESIARPLPAVRGGGEMGVEDWRQGVRLTPPGPDAPFVWPTGCIVPAAAEKDVVDGLADSELFNPLVVGNAVECMPGRSAVGDLVYDNASRGLELRKYEQLAVAMFTGSTGGATIDDNPSLQALPASVTAPGVDAATPKRGRLAMQGLMNAMCQFGGADWVVHAPLASLPVMRNELGLIHGDDGIWRFGDIDFSFECTPIEGPSELEAVPATATNTDGSEFWIWMTRRPMVAWDALLPVRDNVDTTRNRRIVLAEQPAILVFDPTAVLAAKVHAQ